MKISIVDMDRIIAVNKIQEVTSTKLFSNKMLFDPNGILSNDIFGTSKNDRRNTFAYVNLKRHFIHPHIYNKVLKPLFQNISYIIKGEKRFVVKDGIIVEDPEHGWTGLESLYDNWNKIDWNKTKAESSNKIAKEILTKLSRDEVFITKFLIIPPAYRDVMIAGTVDSSDHVNELNNMYLTLLRGVSQLQEGGLFARTQYSTQMRVQTTLVQIMDYFKKLISKKTGLIRKNLLGKSVDYASRSVISLPTYNFERFEDLKCDINHTLVPIAQCCANFYPFIESWLINFFTRELINDPNIAMFYDIAKKKEITAVLKDPESQFSEKNVKKMINDYCLNPDNRFKPIVVNVVLPSSTGDIIREAHLLLKGKVMFENHTEQIINRPMTITDILYIACVDVCEKRHVMVSRYPVGTDKNIYYNKIRVQSTIRHCNLTFNGKEYPDYPVIDFTVPHDRVSTQFIDTIVFSTSHIGGMGADFDGDQIAVRGIWSDEANIEADQIMNSKIAVLNITGGNAKVTSAKEIANSIYELTKEGQGRTIAEAETKELLDLSFKDLTRSKIVELFANVTDDSVTDRSTKIKKARFNTFDSMIVPKGYFFDAQERISTTVGRFILNKFILEGAGCISATGYINKVLNKGALGDIDELIAKLYLEDTIDRNSFNLYTDRRDCLAYWVNGYLSHTISERMYKPLPEVEKKKAELLKKYEKELANHDVDVMNKIEKELIDYAKEILKDDPGMDLYTSGDLNFNNNYKNNSIIKGAVYDEINGKYDFISTSFMNGMDPKDVPAQANSILASQYPTSIETANGGYNGKKLVALLQMMNIDEEGTDCGTKNLIPVTITKYNKKMFNYTYIQVGDQLKLIDSSNIDQFVGKQVKMRSPMSCKNQKICSVCASKLFYLLGIKNPGLFSVQVSDADMNLALKSKHDATVNLFSLNPDGIIEDL